MSRDPSDATNPGTPGARAGQAERPAGLPDRYRLGEILGAGGMGKVYRAHDAVLNRDVAIKVIEAGPAGSGASKPRDRFVREARAAARLAHPNIVAVHDVDADAGWLVMDLVEGKPLRAAGTLPPVQVRAIAEQVLSALDAAHAAGVVHRDIKPSNIIIDAAGKVTLVDFGVARLVDAEMTKTGESLGTPAYMAPEQLRGGAVDARTDLYGLAATLFELVTGERMVAFEAPSPAALGKVRAACKREHGLARVIERCLQATPEARIGSAREALTELARRPRRGRWIALAAGLLLSTGAVTWWLAHRAPADVRRAEVFALAQRGEHEKATLLLEQYVGAHPDDGEARAMQLLNGWWETGVLAEPFPAASSLDPVDRDMLHGLSLLAMRHEDKAIAYLEDAERQHPDSVEIEYALGEARWHGGQLERGVATLEHAFSLDARWQMALHHVEEFRLSRGETAPLAPILAQLRSLDPPRAAALACEKAIADRHPADAAKLAAEALVQGEQLADLFGCLMSAQILDGDLAGAEATAKRPMPIDLREWGTAAITAELLLYRGKLDEYLETAKDNIARQKIIALALLRPSAVIVEDPQVATAIRGQPIVPASQTLVAHVRGQDATAIYAEAPELELRAYGSGLAAELHGDLPAAITEYRRALATPQKGDIKMLIAYQLAKVLAASGDRAGAAAACEDVIAPHQYIAYRAVLLPDCEKWSR